MSPFFIAGLSSSSSIGSAVLERMFSSLQWEPLHRSRDLETEAENRHFREFVLGTSSSF